MSTLPPLWQVIGNAVMPARRSAPGSGESEMSLGDASLNDAVASRTTVDWIQLPPSQPWQSPASVMRAVLPTCAELAGSRRTTTAMTNASPFRASSAASCRISLRMSASLFDRCLHAFVVLGSVDIGERVGRPRQRFRFVTMALHDVPAAALSFRHRQLPEERSVVEHRRSVHTLVVRDHERRV